MDAPYLILREPPPPGQEWRDPGTVSQLPLTDLLVLQADMAGLMHAALRQDPNARARVRDIFVAATTIGAEGRGMATVQAYLLRDALWRELAARENSVAQQPIIDAEGQSVPDPQVQAIGNPDIAPQQDSGGISDPNDKNIGNPDIAPAQVGARPTDIYSPDFARGGCYHEPDLTCPACPR